MIISATHFAKIDNSAMLPIPNEKVGIRAERAASHDFASSRSSEVWFIYLGRKGSLGRFCIELAEAASEAPELNKLFVVSENSTVLRESFSTPSSILRVPTYDRPAFFAVLGGLLTTLKKLRQELKLRKPTAVVSLMPHLYSPFISGFFRRRGIKYVSIIHDAVQHPGDPTGVLTPWLRSEARTSDLVITLSKSVAEHLVALRSIERQKHITLFHPDLRYRGEPVVRRRDNGRPFRLLYFGRVMKYKGLELLADAVELVREAGHAVELGVVGAGTIGNSAQLQKLGAEVINRWIDDDEVASIVNRFDAVCLSHVEASQSGVAALAFGACLPVIANPVGGLTEQVVDSKTGVLSARPTARSFADAIERLYCDEDLYNGISQYLYETRHRRSMASFLDQLTAEVYS